ncbi:MAG: dTDP-4-dehydrorhamnose reductase [Gemmatimonadota bacterium]
MPPADHPVILLLGGSGQVGWELRRTLAPLGDILAPTRAELDLTDEGALRRSIRASKPQVVVNAAAYTAVDQAEAAVSQAEALNARLPRVLAEEAADIDAVLVHYSTDYVFDGAGTHPYREEDQTSPLGVYGRTKLAGDLAVLASGANAYLFRVAWVYGLRGHNFLRTISRLALEREELRVVADQHGAPTWSRMIAEATSTAVGRVLASRALGIEPPQPGLYHLAPPDVTTWHEFATAIVAHVKPAMAGRVFPISGEEYKTVARRPAYSALDSSKFARQFGLRLPGWRGQLTLCLEEWQPFP